MTIKASKMVKLYCPFAKENCVGPKCVNWMSKTDYIEAHSGVWSDGVMVPEGRAKCRLWVDSEEYLF